MTFEEWTATPIGSFALSLAVRAETFSEAETVLRAAWNAAIDEATRERLSESPSEK